MIQQAFRIIGSADLDPTGTMLRVGEETTTGDAFIVGSWDDEGLLEARLEVAHVLGQLDGEREVLDLLTGVRESAAEAVTRLRSMPTPSTCFRFETMEWQGLSFVRLVGLAQFGEPDILVEYESDIRSEQVLELMGNLGHYRIASGRPLLPGEAIPLGYWLLSIASDGIYPDFPVLPHAAELAEGYATAMKVGLTIPAPNFVIEAKDPQRIGDDDWIVGASKALRVIAVQRETHERLAEICGCDVPVGDAAFSGDPVMLCSRVTSSDDFFGHRMSLGDDGASGWQFGCHQEDHLHDETTMAFGVLSQVSLTDMRIIQYLALPTGWSFSKEKDGFWVNAPGDERSFKDEGSADGQPWCRMTDNE